jgi:uncharacterized caspase-like protein
MLALWFCVLIFGTQAFAQEKLRGVALVVGNGAYEHLPKLANPEDDAKSIETLFDDLGFDTAISTDRDLRRLTRDLDRFAEDAKDADVAILYYSGHGIEAGGENYLVPVDADMSSLDSAQDRLVPISQLIAKLQASVPLVIVMLDACRNNPFPSAAMVRISPDSPRSPVAAQGLAAVKGAAPLKPASGDNASVGTVMAFAADPGHAALDGTPGGNSPYAAAILKHLSTLSGEEFGVVMRMVAEEVYLKTGGEQRPWMNESLRRLLYFGKTPTGPTGDEGDILKERRQLLLTIAALPDSDRKQVEIAAAEGGVPMDALYGMLKALGADTPKDPSALDKLLRAQTDRLKQMLAERDALKSTDPEITRLSKLANDATNQGALSTALRLHEAAKARVGEIEKNVDAAEADIKARRIEFATVYAESARAYAISIEPLKAADDYGHAFEQARMWDARLANGYRNARLAALIDDGNFRGDNAALMQAISEGNQALTQDGASLDMPTLVDLRNNIASALATMGDRENSSVRLQQAAELYRETLTRFGTEVSPTLVANTQTSLAFALDALAQRTTDTAGLKQAVTALQAALTIYSQNGDEFLWANAKNSIGNTYWLLGYRTNSIDTYDKAVAAYREVLAVNTRERRPHDWANAQGNLGNALAKIGELRHDPAILRQALAASRAAQQEQPTDRFPIDWAVNEGNIGRTLRELGRQENNMTVVQEAVTAFHRALAVATREAAPFLWARTNTQLGHTLMLLAAHEAGTEHAREAVAAYSSSLAEMTRERIPQEWVFLKRNLASALTLVGQREQDSQSLEQAVSIYRELLQVLSPDSSPIDWGMTQYNLADALRALGLGEQGVEHLEQAMVAYRSAQQVYSRVRWPTEWSQIALSVAEVEVEIARRNGLTPLPGSDVQTSETAHGSSPATRQLEFGAGPAERLRILKQRRAKAQ